MNTIRKAAIDIGSNTTLFLVGDVDGEGKIEIVEEDCVINSIGKDVFHSGRISSNTIQRNIQILLELISKASCSGVEKVIVAGTAALRKASNAAEFTREVFESLGLELRILSEEEEARLSYLGYLSGKNALVGDILLIDIGGGSVEFIKAGGGDVGESFSLELGAVKLLDKFQLGDPPDAGKFRRMERFVEAELSKTGLTDMELMNETVILSGGTASALAAVKMGLVYYRPDAVEGVILEKGWIEGMEAGLLETNIEQRRRMLNFEPDRAAVIIEGTLIALKILTILEAGRCSVTHRGVRFGLLCE